VSLIELILRNIGSLELITYITLYIDPPFCHQLLYNHQS